MYNKFLAFSLDLTTQVTPGNIMLHHVTLHDTCISLHTEKAGSVLWQSEQGNNTHTHPYSSSRQQQQQQQQQQEHYMSSFDVYGVDA